MAQIASRRPARASRSRALLLAAVGVAMAGSACDFAPAPAAPPQPARAQPPPAMTAPPPNGPPAQPPASPYGTVHALQAPGQPQAPPPGPASPLAPSCQSDATCFGFKCNTSTGHCGVPPCQASADCAGGYGCLGAGGPAALCVPGAP